MARAKNQRNGRLEEAMRTLAETQAAMLQTQAAFVQNQAAFQAQLAQMERNNSERFARIEVILFDHSRTLAELIRILQALPEAVRERIGFKATEAQRST